MASLQNKAVCLDELMPILRERVEAGKTVKLSPKGISMLPMLRQGKDSVVLSKIDGEPKKYDVVLYQRANGQYVLHRLVGVKDGYVFLGDNQFDHEYGIERSQMIAYVTTFYRENKEIGIDSLPYKIYYKAWYSSRGLRRFIRRGVGFLKRRLGKICRKDKADTE